MGNLRNDFTRKGEVSIDLYNPVVNRGFPENIGSSKIVTARVESTMATTESLRKTIVASKCTNR